jgi:hypothetical protein
MRSVTDTLSQPLRAEPVRSPFPQPESVQPTLGQGALAIRIVVIGASVLLAVAAQLTTHEFDAAWMLAGLAVFAVFAALLALCLRHIGVVGADISEAWRDAAQRRARRLADRRFMARAEHDPRLMADLQAAIARHEERDELGADAQAKIEQAACVQRQRTTVPLPWL